MRIAVLGCGAVGSTIARILRSREIADEVLCIDRNVKRIKAFLMGDEEGFIVREYDVLRDDIYGELRNYDLVVNALPTSHHIGDKEYPLNIKVMDIALKAGVSYIDLACFGGRSRIAEQIHLNHRFEKNNLFALINAGASPGLTNLLARENSEELDRVETVSIKTLEEQRGSEFVLPWSKAEMFNVASKSLIYRNGKFMFKEPFSEIEPYEFPEPFGRMNTYLISSDEVYTIPYFLKIKNLDVKAAGSDIEVLRTLYRIGIFDDKPISYKGRKISPKKFMYSILPDTPLPSEVVKLVEDRVIEEGYFALFVDNYGKVRREKALMRSYVIFPSQTQINEILPGSSYIAYPTAICTVAFIKALIKRNNVCGVHPPESLEKSLRREVLNFLEKERIFVNTEFKIVENKQR